MDDDESLYVDELSDEAPGATKWHWSFLAMRALCLGSNVANAVRAFCIEVANDVGAHSSYQIERDQFAAEAGRELESILEQES